MFIGLFLKVKKKSTLSIKLQAKEFSVLLFVSPVLCLGKEGQNIAAFFVYFYSKIMKHILLSSSFALSVSVFIVIVPM